jgi:hypothetical protein
VDRRQFLAATSPVALPMGLHKQDAVCNKAKAWLRGCSALLHLPPSSPVSTGRKQT